MGLAVEVGAIAYLIADDPEGADWLRVSFDAVNAVLAENKVPPHKNQSNWPRWTIAPHFSAMLIRFSTTSGALRLMRQKNQGWWSAQDSDMLQLTQAEGRLIGRTTR